MERIAIIIARSDIKDDELQRWLRICETTRTQVQVRKTTPNTSGRNALRIDFVDSTQEQVAETFEQLVLNEAVTVCEEHCESCDARARVTLMIPHPCCGAVIGHGAQNLQTFRELYHVGVVVCQEHSISPVTGVPERKVTMLGAVLDLATVFREMCSFYTRGVLASGAPACTLRGIRVRGDLSNFRGPLCQTEAQYHVHLPSSVRERKLEGIAQLQEVTLTTIRVSPRGSSPRVLSIYGDRQKAWVAEAMVLRHLHPVEGWSLKVSVTVPLLPTTVAVLEGNVQHICSRFSGASVDIEPQTVKGYHACIITTEAISDLQAIQELVSDPLTWCREEETKEEETKEEELAHLNLRQQLFTVERQEEKEEDEAAVMGATTRAEEEEETKEEDPKEEEETKEEDEATVMGATARAEEDTTTMA